MNRTCIEQAVRRLASGRGYAFAAGGDDRMPQSLTAYPAAWLSPLSLRSAEGRCHGRLVYDITLRLMTLASRMTGDGRAAALAAMEEDALGLFADLAAEERIIAVEGLSLAPSLYAFTPHGELALTAEASLITWF